jgi:predicted membrane-bound mannosyltransferase
MSDVMYRGNISVGATDDTRQTLQQVVANFKNASDQVAQAMQKGRGTALTETSRHDQQAGSGEAETRRSTPPYAPQSNQAPLRGAEAAAVSHSRPASSIWAPASSPHADNVRSMSTRGDQRLTIVDL